MIADKIIREERQLVQRYYYSEECIIKMDPQREYGLNLVLAYMFTKLVAPKGSWAFIAVIFLAKKRGFIKLLKNTDQRGVKGVTIILINIF